MASNTDLHVRSAEFWCYIFLIFLRPSVLPINLSVKWQKIRPVILARSKTCQTDLKRRFLFASVNPQSTGQCSKHLEGGRTHGSCFFVCEFLTCKVETLHDSYSYHDSIHNSQLSNKCLLFLFLFHFRTRDLLCHRQFLWHQKKLRSCDLGSFKLQELMGE